MLLRRAFSAVLKLLIFLRMLSMLFLDAPELLEDFLFVFEFVFEFEFAFVFSFKPFVLLLLSVFSVLIFKLLLDSSSCAIIELVFFEILRKEGSTKINRLERVFTRT